MNRTLTALEEEWQRGASRWLPQRTDDSIWRFSGPLTEELPRQGWKLHVSATLLTARAVLDAVAPILADRNVLFKAPTTLLELKRLNCGLFYGYVQVGKVVTVYPRDEQEACALAHELDAATSDFQAPAIPFETPVSSGSSVFTRFGSFGGPEAGAEDHVVSPAGEVTPDRRDQNPEWARPPHGLVRPQPTKRVRESPLARSFRAYQALMQRGKGGVYRALDLTTRPARLCVLKEGRALGEVDWDGSDGLSWIRHERDVLSELATTHVAVPSIYEYFEQGGNGYLVLEWIEGRSVADLVGDDAPLLEIPVALELGRCCAEAVARLHEAGWSWRDLKPQNFIVAEDGVRLVDFEGAARVGDSVGSPWGTAGYLPPEWLESEEISTAQDCYGLGVVLRQLFTNAPVTPGASIPSIGSEREGVPPVVDHLVASLTDPDPARRPSAARVAKALSP